MAYHIKNTIEAHNQAQKDILELRKIPKLDDSIKYKMSELRNERLRLATKKMELLQALSKTTKQLKAVEDYLFMLSELPAKLAEEQNKK
jgi:hypothetical protein